ncbi:MAG TPA: zinc-ribbon domain-containing protein, partial [Geothrix sp.]
MAEAIHCPSCSTRYRLRPERLKPAIRRAKCFSCGSLFPVGDVVQRLLAPPAPSDTSRFKVEDVAAVQHPPLEPFLPPPSLTAGDLEGVDEEILEKTLVDAPTSLPETKVEPSPASVTLPVLVIPTEAPAPAEPIPPPEAQALSEPAVPPEAPAPPEPMGLPEPDAAASEFPPELTEATLSGYTSARDAI